MSESGWEQLERICLEALDQPTDARPAFLDAACGGNEELRREVEGLVAHYDPSFLEQPVARVSGLDIVGEVPDAPHRIGPYRVVRPLGHGGMGAVYLAVHEGEDFQRAVAIKLIRQGIASSDTLERFRLERRILASLNHPNIARLIDGGATEDGRPFFVMEFVEGVPLDTYCDEKRLSVRDRLRLFCSICEAVQHAHRNLVIHRDLKPSNIVVTEGGVPKLLDFGIGKILDPAATGEVTQTGHRALTPEYAAPEQVTGAAITTATDVYGLGVLLYELLTGHHPYADSRDTATDVVRAIVDTAPSPPSVVVSRPRSRRRGGDLETTEADTLSARRDTLPSRLRRQLAGDLDTITLKALRKEPERRYMSPIALADDILRYLSGRPVRARPDSWGYRLQKFAVRNPWAMATAAALVVAIGVSIVVPWVQTRRVESERDKALEVQSFLLEAFGATGANTLGETVTARQLLDGQAARLDSLYADQPALGAEMMRVLAEAYDRLGLYAEAESFAREALAIQQDLHPGAHSDVAAGLNMVGWLLHQRGESQAGEVFLRDAVEMRRGLGRGERGELSRSLNDLGVVREALGDYDEARALHQAALELRQVVYGSSHRATGVSASNLSVILYRDGDYAGAREMGETALAALRGALGPDHQRSVIVQSNLAAFRTAEGDLAAAAAEYRDLLERQSRIQGPEHPVTLSVMGSLGTVLFHREEWSEAVGVLREALRLERKVLGARHGRVVSTARLLGRALAAQGEMQEAFTLFDKAFDIGREVLGSDHVEVAETVAAIAAARTLQGEWARAEVVYRDVVSLFVNSLGPDHPQTATQRFLYGETLLRLDRAHEAHRELAEAHRIARERLPQQHEFRHQTRIRLAQAHILKGEHGVADSLLAIEREALRQNRLDDGTRTLLATVDSLRSTE